MLTRHQSRTLRNLIAELVQAERDAEVAGALDPSDAEDVRRDRDVAETRLADYIKKVTA